MTVVVMPEFTLPLFGNAAQNSTIVTQGNSAITSANVSAAAIIEAPKTGTVSKIFVLIGTVSGASPTIDARLETVSGASPSGTLFATNSNGSQVVANNTGYEVTLTGSAAVTKGDILAIVITYSAGTTINVKVNNAQMQSKYPYGMLKTAGTYAAASTPVVALGYNDSTYPENYPLVPAVATATTYNSTSTPDERGNIFQLPVSLRAVGFQVAYQNAATSADFDLVLYDSNGTSTLASVSIDADQLFGTSGGWMKVYFSAAVTLLANTAYRVTVKPTTANDNAWVRYQALNTTVMQALPGKGVWYGTSRTDAGAWTEVTTDWYPIGLLFDGIDTAGGLLLNSGMQGGLRG